MELQSASFYTQSNTEVIILMGLSFDNIININIKNLTYHKWSNKHPLSNKRLLSNNCPPPPPFPMLLNLYQMLSNKCPASWKLIQNTRKWRNRAKKINQFINLIAWLTSVCVLCHDQFLVQSKDKLSAHSWDSVNTKTFLAESILHTVLLSLLK